MEDSAWFRLCPVYRDIGGAAGCTRQCRHRGELSFPVIALFTAAFPIANFDEPPSLAFVVRSFCNQLSCVETSSPTMINLIAFKTGCDMPSQHGWDLHPGLSRAVFNGRVVTNHPHRLCRTSCWNCCSLHNTASGRQPPGGMARPHWNLSTHHPIGPQTVLS